MKKNYGGTIQTFAVIILGIMIIGSIVGGIVIIANISFFPGFGVMVGGVFASLFLYYLIAGFGQLVENSGIIAEHFDAVNEKERVKQEKKEKQKIEKQAKAAKAMLEDPKTPGGQWIDLVCPFCGENISFKKENLTSGEPVECPLCGESIDMKDFNISLD